MIDIIVFSIFSGAKELPSTEWFIQPPSLVSRSVASGRDAAPNGEDGVYVAPNGFVGPIDYRAWVAKQVVDLNSDIFGVREDASWALELDGFRWRAYLPDLSSLPPETLMRLKFLSRQYGGLVDEQRVPGSGDPRSLLEIRADEVCPITRVIHPPDYFWR